MNAWDTIKQQIADAIGQAANGFLDAIVQWLVSSIYNAFNGFINNFNQDAVTLLSLHWVQTIVLFVQWFGMGLFVIGMFVAVADCAIEYQEGRGGIQNTALNILKGFLAAMLFATLPIELYKFCINLNELLGNGITSVFVQSTVGSSNLTSLVTDSFNSFTQGTNQTLGTILVQMIAFIYCVVKIFFANIKRGGILLTQIAIGSLYMFSIPRGYQDAFWNWCKQVIGTCFTAFMQTTLLYLGVLTAKNYPMLGLGVMLAASEVPRIAQQFGLDTSIRGNMTSAIFATNSAVNLVKTIRK